MLQYMPCILGGNYTGIPITSLATVEADMALEQKQLQKSVEERVTQ